MSLFVCDRISELLFLCPVPEKLSGTTDRFLKGPALAISSVRFFHSSSDHTGLATGARDNSCELDLFGCSVGKNAALEEALEILKPRRIKSPIPLFRFGLFFGRRSFGHGP